MAEILLVTGAIGKGKTTWCRELVERLRKDGSQVCGVLSPAVFEDGQKVGIDMINLASGEQRGFAVRRPQDSSALTKCWSMNEETIAWANHVLRQCAGCDCLIIDELGPVEFIQGQGLQEGMILLDSGQFSQAYVVVRPHLLPQAQARWPDARVFNVEAKA